MRALLLYLRRQADLEPSRRKLWLPVFFALGIGFYFLLPEEPSKWLTLSIIEGLIAAAVLFRFHPRVLKILLLAALIAGGFGWAQVRTIYINSHMGGVPENKLYLRGEILRVDHNQKGKLRLTMDHLYNFDEQRVPGHFRITLRQKEGAYQAGQCVELVARLLPRAKAQLPGGYQFDRKNFYDRLSGSGYAESMALPVECSRQAPLLSGLQAAVNNGRQKIVSHINDVLPADQVSVVAAILAGEQGGIRPGLIQNYRNSGLAHFLSISGLHMSMIAGLMFFFIRLLLAMFPPLALRCDSKKVSAVAAIIISAVYLLISGAAIPAQRAFIMTLIVLLGVLFNRRAISMYTIAWAAVFVLFFAPEALIGASFQMSFAAVIALIAFYEKFAARLSRWFKTDKTSLVMTAIKILAVYVIGILVADLVASLATLPFAVYHFNRVAVYTSLANLLAGPVIGLLIMPFTLLSLLLMPLGLDYYSLQIVGFGIGLVNDITAWVSSLPGASLQVLSMPLWGLLLIVFGGLWLCLWERRWRWWGALAVVAGILSIAAAGKPDLLINEDGTLIAIKDTRNNLVVLPARGQSFTKQVWQDKTASPPLSKNRSVLLCKVWQGKAKAPKWLDLSCGKTECRYKDRVKIIKGRGVEVDGRPLSLEGTGGVAVYLRRPAEVVSVRRDIGSRLWNR